MTQPPLAPTTRHVHHYLAEHRGYYSAGEISEEMNIPLSTVYDALAELREYDLLDSLVHTDPKRHRVSEFRKTGVINDN